MRLLTSPSTRRAWIEICADRVACGFAAASPSTRRAWIEIVKMQKMTNEVEVALHPEGVDRNRRIYRCIIGMEVALHPEGVDRNRQHVGVKVQFVGRPPPGGRG